MYSNRKAQQNQKGNVIVSKYEPQEVNLLPVRKTLPTACYVTEYGIYVPQVKLSFQKKQLFI